MTKPYEFLTHYYYMPLAYKKFFDLYKGDIKNRYAYTGIEVLNLMNRYAYLVRMGEVSKLGRYGKCRNTSATVQDSGTTFDWNYPILPDISQADIEAMNSILVHTNTKGNHIYSASEHTSDYEYFIIEGGEANG